MSTTEEDTTTECNALKIRIEFLEETVRNYRSLPADLLSTFDVTRCNGNCEVLRQNFWDVWNTNASLHGKFEHEMRRYKVAVKSRDARLMELESVNALLERGLNQSNAQLFEMRRGAVERLAEESEDIEAFFSRKLEEERALSTAMRSRIAELEETLYLKEHESGARQMQINHLLSLSNQLEHAAEVNTMRNKLREANKMIDEITRKQIFAAAAADNNNINNNNNKDSSSSMSVVVVAPAAVVAPLVFSIAPPPQINIENDQRLAWRFKDFFRRLDVDGHPSADNLEEHMYDQFLLDQPNKEAHKWRKDMLTRDEIIQAMHAIGCGVNTTTKKKMKKQQQQLLVGEHGVRICKRDFAACLASMGGKFKRRRGVRFWVNIGMTRKPLFSWDKNE